MLDSSGWLKFSWTKRSSKTWSFTKDLVLLNLWTCRVVNGYNWAWFRIRVLRSMINKPWNKSTLTALQWMRTNAPKVLSCVPYGPGTCLLGWHVVQQGFSQCTMFWIYTPQPRIPVAHEGLQGIPILKQMVMSSRHGLSESWVGLGGHWRVVQVAMIEADVTCFTSLLSACEKSQRVPRFCVGRLSWRKR